MTASEPDPFSRRLFITDRTSQTQFLIDTGADLCVNVANGTSINTYGTITLRLNFRLCRDFTWRFVIAEVSKPIIGVDFLSHYNLLVDVRNQCLLYGLTQLTARGHVSKCSIPSIKVVVGKTEYDGLLREFPENT